jgi:hypothetical protein
VAPDAKTTVDRKCIDPELAGRIALFAVVSKNDRAAAVLEGLSRAQCAAAQKVLAEAATWSSATRQARVTLEFGSRGDQHERLASIVSEAPPLLRLAMCAQMSPQQQARFPKLANIEFRRLPGRDAFAARLVREASR